MISSSIRTQEVSQNAVASSLSRFRYVRVVLALILGCAGVLKAYALLTRPTVEATWLDARWIQIVAAATEITLCAWLLSTHLSRLPWRVCLCIFSLFSIVATWKWVSGAHSCGCFGDVKIHPAWAASLDLACLAGLAWARPAEDKTEFNFRDLKIATLVVAFAGVPFLVTASITRPEFRDEIRPGGFYLVDPEAWVGKTCPIIEHVESRRDLSTGQHLLVFVRHDCHTCEERLPQYRDMAASSGNVTLIEVPPFGAGFLELDGRLSGDVDWFVETPLEIEIEEGKVTGFSKDSARLRGWSSHPLAKL